MAFRRYRKYAQSTSPSRQFNQEDPQPRRENNDMSFLIDALTHRILESDLMNDKFLKNFFLSKDEQKNESNEYRSIVEKKLNWALRYSRKAQNQGILRVIEDYAKEKGILFDEQVKFQQYDLLEKPLILQPTVLVTRDREWLDIFEKFKSENLKIDPNQNPSELKKTINNNSLTNCQKIQLILKQRFTMHDATSFPNENPQVGNKDKDGNIIFMLDEQQMPHRVIFRNKEEYDIIDWFIQRTTKINLKLLMLNGTNIQKMLKNQGGTKFKRREKLQKQKSTN